MMRYASTLIVATACFAAAALVQAAPTQQPKPRASADVHIAAPSRSVAQSMVRAGSDRSELIKRIAPRGISEEFYTCIDQSRNSALKYSACLSNEAAMQNVRLNKIYNELLANVNKSEKTDLLDAQRSWVKMKTKDEAFELKLYERGQLDNADTALNDMFRTCTRANQLETFLGWIKS